MIRVQLIPAQSSAGGPRVFQVAGFEYDVTTQHLTLALRDGKMCVALAGQWQMRVNPSQIAPHSIAEAERIHDDRTLVVMAD